MGTLYHSDENDDFLGPNPEEIYANRLRIEEKNRIERIAHTYKLKCGDVTFECHLPYSSPKDGKLWAKIEVSMLPDEMIPSEISRRTLDRATNNLGWHGYIEGDFIQDEGGVFVASDHWMQRFGQACERVRRVHRILIEGEEHHFPIVSTQSEGGVLSKAEANANGQILPLVRDLREKCWILEV